MGDTAHTTESVRAHEISAKYQHSLDKAFADLTSWYNPTLTTHKFLVFRQSSWKLHSANWNKMLEDVDDNNSLFRFILDKRREYWDDKQSGMAYFALLRSSSKRQMKNQKFQYSYTAEDNLNLLVSEKD